jgi:hypothetical protein
VIPQDRSMDLISELMARLSPEQQQDVLDFALYLAEEECRPKLHLDWVGGLAEFKEKYTSVQLQKESLDWWGD